MYLSNLEMVGFKSFANKTDLSFTDGVTAIVGPNGCGKTNIVDAIRWVLGEQKSSALRADGMEQVIFNGSKTRKPLGMAEVSLTIENNKQILPTEYSQVTITRRLFRSGESQYLLNKTQCRLRDIIDLFMDTGMGSDAYSVIELKMIETILSDKAEERRHLFEEAAGVTKYKARRREAARKLESAQRDIARVQDIVREVQKTVNSLARQAEKARQHQELSTQLRALDQLLFSFEYLEEYIALKQFEAQIIEVRTRREAAEAELLRREGAHAAAETEQTSKDAELRTALDAESNLRASLGDAQQHVSLLDERANAIQRALERLEREHTESEQLQSTTSQQLHTVGERLDALRNETSTARTDVEEKRATVDQATQAMIAARQETNARREALNTSRQLLAEQRNTADRFRIQSDGLQRRLRDNEAQQQQAEERLRHVSDQLAKEQEEIPALDAQLQAAEASLHSGEERQSTLRAEQETLQQESEHMRAQAAHTKASLEFLIGLVDTTESSKFLLSTPEWTPQGEKVTLAEVLNTDNELRVAIEAALGDSARYFIVHSKDEAAQAIGALSRHNVGKATFLCRDSIPNLSAPGTLPAIDGVRGWARELVRTDDQLRGAVRGILGKTVVVDTVDQAWAAVGTGMCEAAVTLAGEIVRAAGAIRGGSGSRTEGVRVGRKERIAELTQEHAVLETRLSEIETRVRAIKAELATIDVRKLADDVRRVAVVRNERMQRLDAFRGRIDDVNAQRELLHSEAEKFRTELQELGTQHEQAQGAILSIESGVADLERDVHSAQSELQNIEHGLADVTASFRAAEIRLVRLSGDLQALESDQHRLTDERSTIESRRDQRETEREQLRAEIESTRGEHGTRVMEASALSASLAHARAQRESLELSLREAQATLQSAAEDVRKQRKDVDTTTEAMHESDLRFNEVRLRMESHILRATEELSIEVPEGEPVAPTTDLTPDELRTQVQELRRKLTSMGNVNFLALEEHEREGERLEFLTTQLTDLIDSERTLQETITEINLTARDQFTKTFDQIRTNFRELFTVLFSEDDEADLQMIDDEDPLECKIEITAKPRGKRPHSIEMLSGGEKTLTAIALLFAIYLVKPSPFCVLDEVDAPLDDANIDRYLKIIRKFSERTQFLMITHNKKTMEAADTLYGVTMEEAAVSKLVSVQLSGKN